MSDNSIDLVITNSGDGSNGIRWVIDEEVIALMEEMADEGDERYASGDGLQVRTLRFPTPFDRDQFIKLNHISVVTLKDLE